jgi:hypothetical protein
MKLVPSILIAGALLLIIISSCKKQSFQLLLTGRNAERQIQFRLSTDQDFSSDNHLIVFKIFIQRLGNVVLWDTSLAPMKVKDIPGPANKLVINKSIVVNDTSVLKVGFRYTIENVGESWHIDSSGAGSVYTIIDFNFR